MAPDPTPFERNVTLLAPEVVAYWRKLLDRALPFVEEGRKPCDYTPWMLALRRAEGRPLPPKGRVPDAFLERFPDLMGFAVTLSRPGWPEARDDLIDFALRFLEADVMLFRAGYTKRHMLRRLQQAKLREPDVVRIRALLLRAVIEGQDPRAQVWKSFGPTSGWGRNWSCRNTCPVGKTS